MIALRVSKQTRSIFEVQNSNKLSVSSCGGCRYVDEECSHHQHCHMDMDGMTLVETHFPRFSERLLLYELSNCVGRAPSLQRRSASSMMSISGPRSWRDLGWTPSTLHTRHCIGTDLQGTRLHIVDIFMMH